MTQYSLFMRVARTLISWKISHTLAGVRPAAMDPSSAFLSAFGPEARDHRVEREAQDRALQEGQVALQEVVP